MTPREIRRLVEGRFDQAIGELDFLLDRKVPLKQLREDLYVYRQWLQVLKRSAGRTIWRPPPVKRKR